MAIALKAFRNASCVRSRASSGWPQIRQHAVLVTSHQVREGVCSAGLDLADQCGVVGLECGPVLPQGDFHQPLGRTNSAPVPNNPRKKAMAERRRRTAAPPTRIRSDVAAFIGQTGARVNGFLIGVDCV